LDDLQRLSGYFARENRLQNLLQDFLRGRVGLIADPCLNYVDHCHERLDGDFLVLGPHAQFALDPGELRHPTQSTHAQLCDLPLEPML
jgi:hypothetical protein